MFSYIDRSRLSTGYTHYFSFLDHLSDFYIHKFVTCETHADLRYCTPYTIHSRRLGTLLS